MKKRNPFSPSNILILLVILGSVFACGESKEIKIGLVLPLTGIGTYNGVELLRGIRYAADEANKWGGINDRPIRLIVKGSASDPEKARVLFGEIDKTEKPLCYMTSLSGVAAKLAPEAEAIHVSLFWLVTTANGITENRRYVYRYWPESADQSNALFVLLDKLKPSHLVVLYVDDPAGNSIRDTIMSRNSAKAEYGIESFPINSNESDYDRSPHIQSELPVQRRCQERIRAYHREKIRPLHRDRVRYGAHPVREIIRGSSEINRTALHDVLQKGFVHTGVFGTVDRLHGPDGALRARGPL